VVRNPVLLAIGIVLLVGAAALFLARIARPDPQP
jgi:hypothetical protein